MTKEQLIKFALTLAAAVIPIVISTFPGLPAVLVAVLSALATFAGGTVLHNALPPGAKQ